MDCDHVNNLVEKGFIQKDMIQSPYFLFAVDKNNKDITMLIPIYFCPICGKPLEISGVL